MLFEYFNFLVIVFLFGLIREDVCRVPFGVVYSIPKPGRVHDGELQFDTFLFYIHCVLGDFYSLCDPLYGKDTNARLSISATTHGRANGEKKYIKSWGSLTFSIEQLPIFVKICEKETVDQGGLSQAGLPFKQKTTQKKKARLFSLFELNSGLKIKCLLMCTAGFTCHHEREVKSLLH